MSKKRSRVDQRRRRQKHNSKGGTNNREQATKRDARAAAAAQRAQRITSPLPTITEEVSTEEQPRKKRKQLQTHTGRHAEALKRSTIQYFY